MAAVAGPVPGRRFVPDGVAVLLDGLDGMIARLTHTTSDFGREMDSLADVISFGMAPAVLAGRRPRWGDEPSATQPVALLDEKQLELRAALSALRREIEARTDDVGHKFPEVARAIHAGDEPERAIRGRARATSRRPRCARFERRRLVAPRGASSARAETCWP